MKKTNKEKLISKIKNFFKNSAMETYRSSDMFITDETLEGIFISIAQGGGEVSKENIEEINKDGVETVNLNFVHFNDMSEEELTEILENIIEPLEIDEQKFFEKIRSNNY